MATDLEIHGPVAIPFSTRRQGTGKMILKVNIQEFWDQPEASSMKNKQGCYVFALKAGKGFTPWYIGQTKNRMDKECFTSHKLEKFNEVLFEKGWGKPVMFFVVPKGDKKVVATKELGDIETFLIQVGVKKNGELKNIKHAKNFGNWSIKGVFNGGKGKPTGREAGFKKMMGL